ncbi:site-specific integrase [Mesonia maritima]|uniref:Integrase n=1 Tax=Mesonia maritima TaxID=1793873 RepID=A0ABU1K2R3_9FLAO|nr:site-specific integrase [Mesonia maritima]MDR6299896.1 integrase [Mesonia maritima]
MYDDRILILFYLQKARINKRKQCPIICRITYNKKRKQFSTGLFIEPTNWDPNAQTTSNSQLNDQLEIISSEIRSSYLKLKISGDVYSVDDIYKEFKGETTETNFGVIEYYETILSKKNKLIGKEIKQATWNKFYYIFNDLKQFIKWKFNKKDYLLRDLNMNFIEEFEYFLITEKDNKQITANKVLQRFKSVIRNAVGENHLDKDPFYNHKAKRVKKKVVYLTRDELNKLENKSISQERLSNTRDCFVFCCYTGLAYKEMANLKTQHITKGFDNMLWIQMTREKTDKLISIPVLPKALEIIKKYEDRNDKCVLPVVSNQRFNSYLKEIATIVGIDKNLTHHMARKTFASTVLLYNDVPMEIVSELLGHSSIKITESHYGKIVQKKVSEHISKLSKKLGY